jgi:hypothetical protein
MSNNNFLSNSLVNAVITVTCSAAGINAAKLQQFGVDSMVDIPDLSDIKAEITVDGYMVASAIAALIELGLSLNAASSAARLFDSIGALRRKNGEAILIEQLDISFYSIKKHYSFSNLAMTSYTPAPSGKQTLQNMSYKLTCSTIDIAVSNL